MTENLDMKIDACLYLSRMCELDYMFYRSAGDQLNAKACLDNANGYILQARQHRREARAEQKARAANPRA